MRYVTMTMSSNNPSVDFPALINNLNIYLRDKKDANPKVEWLQSTMPYPEGLNDRGKVMVTLTAIVATDDEYLF